MTYLHDAPALEEVDLLSIRKGIRESWNTSIGVNGQKPRLLLGAIVGCVSIQKRGFTRDS